MYNDLYLPQQWYLMEKQRNHRVGQARRDLRRSNFSSEQVLSLEWICLDFVQSDPENLLKTFQSFSGQLVPKLQNKTTFILVLARIPLPISSFLGNVSHFHAVLLSFSLPSSVTSSAQEAALRSPDTISSPGCHSLYWNIFFILWYF